MPPTPERWPSADDPAPVDAGPPQAEPVEERPADELSTDRADASGGRAHQDPGGAAPPRQVRPCRLPFGGAAVHPTAGRPLRRVSDFANLTKPWFITACFLALFGGPHGRRAALTGLVAIGAASLLVNQPMKLIGKRHRPRPGRPRRTTAAMGHHALVDVVSVRSLRVRRRVRGCRRRPAAGAQASVAWRSVGRGIFPRVHRRALPERCSRRRDRGPPPRPGGLSICSVVTSIPLQGQKGGGGRVRVIGRWSAVAASRGEG
jgi:hypothetical protein